MKKIYTLFAALGLCAMSASAAITVTLENGAPVSNGETITVTAEQFEHQFIPSILDNWMGKVDVKVDGVAPIEVSLLSTSGNIQFCPVGQNCYTLFPSLVGFTGSGVLTNNVTSIPVDMNYQNYDFDNPQTELPAGKETLTANFKDATGAEFTVKFVFDSNTDSGVDAIADADGTVTVYSIAGVCVLNKAEASALGSLPAGLYIVNGRKMAVK
ncbi:MAG: hypothetical protein K2J15_04490 [Muribaculaceae bacterium]|nr:hypothetical protein [Muribaculaceae bacterium]